MIVEHAMRRFAGGLILAAVAAGLAGCVEQVGGLQADASSAAAPRIQARPGVSPSAATLAVASFNGPPVAIAQKFDQQWQAAAASREVVLTDPGKARYFARGYLNAYPVEGGAAVAIVWDVFDGQKRRLQRLEDALILKGSAQDPWALVDDRALTAIAGRSAQDMAALLTNTPEAIASGAIARATPAGPFPAATQPPARALGYTAVR